MCARSRKRKRAAARRAHARTSERLSGQRGAAGARLSRGPAWQVLPKFILRLLRGEKACVHGTGEALRSYLHVDDVVECPQDAQTHANTARTGGGLRGDREREGGRGR